MEVAFIFIILSTVLLWFVIGARGHWGVKMAAIFAVLMFSLNIVRSLDNLSGWATTQELPPKFLVHWTLVKEPNKSLDTEGNIYLWVSDLDRSSKNTLEFFQYDQRTEPRAYQLPYSLDMHRMTLQMMERLRMGMPIVGLSEGQRERLNSPGELLNSLSGKKAREEIGSINNYNLDEEDDKLFFYELPESGMVSPKSVE